MSRRYILSSFQHGIRVQLRSPRGKVVSFTNHSHQVCLQHESAMAKMPKSFGNVKIGQSTSVNGPTQIFAAMSDGSFIPTAEHTLNENNYLKGS